MYYYLFGVKSLLQQDKWPLTFQSQKAKMMIKNYCSDIYIYMLFKLSGQSPWKMIALLYKIFRVLIELCLINVDENWNETAVKGEGNNSMCSIGVSEFLEKMCCLFSWGSLLQIHLWPNECNSSLPSRKENHVRTFTSK